MSARNVARLALQSTRQFSRSSVASSGEVAEGYKQLKHVQAKFQKPDGKPVFLKGGPVDKVLYYTTMGLCLVGIAGMGKVIFELSFPKKEE
ncbi:cytochrome c oxidase subunit 7A, mitochondrial [Armigeres subalbatus]|uniref:cytochrome c oxidase subunit 7A, mitochondrial n=1 Tax=Armigeres subalbatus TaxID=124917 RepID=UPI002ED493A8